MAESIREPHQQRSIDKKNRIISAGYDLFARNGYFCTNTAEIAKLAGVSTGIVYGYFHDKRDILLEVLDIYVSKVFNPVLAMFDKLKAPLDFERIIPHIVDNVVDTHTHNAAIHEALHSLSYTDPSVNAKFLELEKQITVKLVEKLSALDYSGEDVTERVHLAMETVQYYAHERVFDTHSYVDYSKMRSIVIKLLVGLFV